MNQPGLSGAARPKRKTQPNIERAGDVINSQIVHGDNNVVIWGDGNVVVQKVSRNQKPKVTPLAPPAVSVGRPGHPVYLLDRDVEKQSANETLRSGAPLEFFCPPGFGKSTLLRYFATQLQLSTGMVLLELNNRMPLEDLYQELFEAFYQSDSLYKPSQVQYKRFFETIQALILLDDVHLTREELQSLRFALPQCVFLIASAEPRLGGEGTTIQVRGLPMQESLTLMEKQAGRALTAEELPFVKTICSTLQGNPLKIMEAAGAVRNEGKSFETVAQSLQTTTPDESLHETSLAAIPDAQKKVLALLAVLGGAPLPEEHLAAILGTKDLAPLLQGLLRDGVVKSHSPRYSLTGSLSEYINRNWDLAQWRETVLRHFVDWSERGAPREQVLEATSAIFRVLESAAQTNRWREVLQIGLAVEPAFILGKRWGAWAQLLALLLRASQALGERAIEAWALHQIGSRALAMDQLQEAREFLTRALEIRRAIGDQSGITATLYNLRQLEGGVPPRTPPRSNGGGMRFGGLIVLLVAVLGLGALAVGALGLGFWRLSQSPPPDGAIPITGPSDPPPAAASTRTPTEPPNIDAAMITTVAPTRTSTPSRTPSRTPTNIPPTRTRTRTRTPTATFIPNDIPGVPDALYPLQDQIVYCGDSVYISWSEPYDASGIDYYLVRLQFYSDEWITVIDKESIYSTELDISNYVAEYCGSYLAWTVSAVDTEGAQGEWVEPITFYAEEPAPPNVAPPAPEVISPYAGQEVSCPSPTRPLVLTWNEPSDASGISYYELYLQSYDFTTSIWTERFSGTTGATSFDATTYVLCAAYNAWAVRAVDNEGAAGAWSPSIEYYVIDPGPR